MKKILLATLLLSSILLTSFTYPNTVDIKNYFGIAELINFNNEAYKLAYSIHPALIFYKQIYTPENETIDHYNNMVMIHFFRSDISVVDLVNEQARKLEERKKTDTECRSSSFESPDGKEIILEFTMSERKDNEVNMIQWNAYRYKEYTDKAGHRGVIIFCIIHRAYDEQIKSFLSSFEDYKMNIVNKLIQAELPQINVE